MDRRVVKAMVFPLLLALMLPVIVQAGDYNYTTNYSKITITKYTGTDAVVSIPGKIENLPVAVIGNSTFSGCANLTSVIIPDSVTSLGDNVFYGCSSLASVTIGTNVWAIGYAAFYNCTNLTSVIIPNSVSSIREYTFYGCSSLASVTIGANVWAIGYAAFYGCSSLASVTIPDGVGGSIASFAFSGCRGLTNAIIGNNVSGIGDDAFSSTSLTSVTIPNRVSYIGVGAFYNCTNLTSVILSDSVTLLLDLAFYRCSNLTSVYFKGHAPSGGADCFLNTKATVYYLSSTTGWPPVPDLWAGRPTALWQPQMLGGDGFGVLTNQFGFNINWAFAKGMVVVVEACTNLTDNDWSPLQTNTLSGDSCYFSDPGWTNYPNRFYRVRMP